MNLMRDPAESALNNVVRSAEQAAELHEDAAERATDADVSALFARLAAERRQLAERLAHSVKALGELPEAPDPDAEDLHRLWNAVRSFFAVEANRTLLDDRERAEQELARAVDAACDEELSLEARRLLGWAKGRIAIAREQLRDASEELAQGVG